MPILKDFKFHSPGFLSEAVELLEGAEAPLLLAGGTFALNTLKKSAKYPSDVISLKKISELRGIEKQGKELRIGAMARIYELLDSKLISDLFPSLIAAASKLATTPIRHMATIGGNIASRFYWVDLPAVLISLGARVTVVEGEKKRSVDLFDFLSEKPVKNRILTEILLPLEKRAAFYFRHTRTVQEIDVPYLGVAFSCVKGEDILKDLRLVVNTTMSFPVFFQNTSEMLKDSRYKTVRLEGIHSAVLKDAQGTKLDEYRIQLVCADVEKLIGCLK